MLYISWKKIVSKIMTHHLPKPNGLAPLAPALCQDCKNSGKVHFPLLLGALFMNAFAFCIAGSQEDLRLCYLRHAFGLGEHYNSVKAIADTEGDDLRDSGDL